MIGANEGNLCIRLNFHHLHRWAPKHAITSAY
jgi:hypothetical protein